MIQAEATKLVESAEAKPGPQLLFRTKIFYVSGATEMIETKVPFRIMQSGVVEFILAGGKVTFINFAAVRKLENTVLELAPKLIITDEDDDDN